MIGEWRIEGFTMEEKEENDGDQKKLDSILEKNAVTAETGLGGYYSFECIAMGITIYI